MYSMQRTVSVKLDVPDGFLDYLKTCSEVFNRHVEWAFLNKTYNKLKANQDLYHQLREEFSKYPLLLFKSIRDTACEAVKATKFKFKPTKKPYSHIRYNKNTFSFEVIVVFSWSGKRLETIIKLPKFFTKRYANWKFQSATIGLDKEKCYQSESYIHCTYATTSSIRK